MKNRSLISRILSGCLFVLFLVAADQLSKYAALRLRSGDIVLIKGVLRLMYAENTGAAWSLFSGKSPLLIAVTSLLILYVVMVWISLCRKGNDYRLLRILLLSVAAGGAGNLIDRIRLGYVIDFIYFELIRFPVFNLADCYITCGVFAVIISFMTVYRKEDPELLMPFLKKEKP